MTDFRQYIKYLYLLVGILAGERVPLWKRVLA